MAIIVKSARGQCLKSCTFAPLNGGGIMFEKLLRHDELNNELEEAREQTLRLKGELLRKDLKIKNQAEKLEALHEEVAKLKEDLDIQKFSPDRFGRISRATERNLNILQELKAEGLSYAKIAERMVGYTGEDWSKSTVHYMLKRYSS